jgi:hypothetical protein
LLTAAAGAPPTPPGWPIWAIKWSFVILAITAALQILGVHASGSVALIADTIHNFADATPAERAAYELPEDLVGLPYCGGVCDRRG